MRRLSNEEFNKLLDEVRNDPECIKVIDDMIQSTMGPSKHCRATRRSS